MAPDVRIQTHTVLGRWTAFAAAGGAGFVLQMAALALLTRVAGLHYLIATAIAVEVAILSNFLWHERWTWRDRPVAGRRARLSRLWRFNLLTGLTSIAGTVGVAAVLVQSAGLSALTANAIAVGLLGLLNFAGAELLVFRAAAVGLLCLATPADAATLQPKAAEDFARYAAAVEARSARELQSHTPLLTVERQAPARANAARAALLRGEILVAPGPPGSSEAAGVEVPGGLINHWGGTVFIPGLTLKTLLHDLKNPGADFQRQEDVVRSRVIARRGNDDLKVYLRLKRTKIVTVVYDTEHEVRFRKLGPRQAASSSVATRIVEVEDAGTANEWTRPMGDDHGFLWRLNSYWRYEETAGGVIVELESLTLSRDVPAIFKPIVRPVIDGVARESVTRTLASLRARFTSSEASPQTDEHVAPPR